MNTARVLDFQTAQQESELKRFQELIRKAADKFAKSLAEMLFSDKSMSLQDISNYIQENKQAFLGEVLQRVVQTRYADYLEQKKAACPICERTVSKQGDFSRQVDTLQGTSEITRPYFYCRDCKHGFFPLDEAIGLSERRKQYDLQSLAAEFLAEMPFERASEVFEKSTGVSFTDSRMHSLFASFAGQADLEDVVPSEEEIENRINQVKGQEKQRPILVVAADGAHVKLRPPGGRSHKRGAGEYKEAKGFRMYLLNEGEILQVASWHQKETAAELGADLKTVAERIPRDKVRVCLIADGDPNLWKAMKEAFPNAREVLDYYHASQYIHDVAESYYANDSNKAMHWVESTMARLSLKGGASHVIGGLKRMKPQSEEVKEKIRKTINYLSNNKERLNYWGARVGGYPIGSGGIESANRFICHTRLKRSGAWWLVPNCNNMLKLRCAIVNGTFDDVFAKYVTREQAKRFAKNA